MPPRKSIDLTSPYSAAHGVDLTVPGTPALQQPFHDLKMASRRARRQRVLPMGKVGSWREMGRQGEWKVRQERFQASFPSSPEFPPHWLRAHFSVSKCPPCRAAGCVFVPDTAGSGTSPTSYLEGPSAAPEHVAAVSGTHSFGSTAGRQGSRTPPQLCTFSCPKQSAFLSHLSASRLPRARHTRTSSSLQYILFSASSATPDSPRFPKARQPKQVPLVNNNIVAILLTVAAPGRSWPEVVRSKPTGTSLG